MKVRSVLLASTSTAVLLGTLLAAPLASAIDVSVRGETCMIAGTEQDREDYRRALHDATEEMLEALHEELPSASEDLDAVTTDLAVIFPDETTGEPEITPELARIRHAAGEAGFHEGEVLHVLRTVHHLRTNDVAGTILPEDVTVTKGQAAHALAQTEGTSRETLVEAGGFSENMTRVLTPLLDVELAVLPTYRDVYAACGDGEGGSFPVAQHLPAPEDEDTDDEAPVEETAGDPISRFLSSLFSGGSSR